MFLKIFNNSNGVFNKDYHIQLLAALSVTLITFAHGITAAWVAPMLLKLQSVEKTPLTFVLTLEEASWVGSLISFGGLAGNLSFGFLLDRFGRKICLYGLAVPQVCAWLLIYFARSVMYLYISRICIGATGGACYSVLPIFIGEISDNNLRGRLTSLFSLTLNLGMMIGYIIAAHLNYFLIPCVCIALPFLYLFLATLLPETPSYLLRCGEEEKAERSFKFYKNYKHSMEKSKLEAIENEFAGLKSTAAVQKITDQGNKNSISDFFTKSALKALCNGFVLVFVNGFSGISALLFYTSNVFAAAKVATDPNMNTIIIGIVQVIGTICAMAVIDRYGRKILLIISTGGMGICTALFGFYGFFAEQTAYDLSGFNRWLPLLLMILIIFLANIGIISVTFVLLVEIMPAKVRSHTVSICFSLMFIVSFGSLKTFPIFLHVLGLSITMWMCSAVCAFGLFYISIFIPETKGKSLMEG